MPLRNEPLTALRTLDSLKVDAANLGRRDPASALRANGVERRLYFVEINLLLLWHARDCLTVREKPFRPYRSWSPIRGNNLHIQVVRSRPGLVLGVKSNPLWFAFLLG